MEILIKLLTTLGIMIGAELVAAIIELPLAMPTEPAQMERQHER